MNKIAALLKLVLALGISAVGPVAGARLPDNARLTVGEVHIDYCDSDPDIAVAVIHVRLAITNRGKQRLILSREFGPVENYRVSKEAGGLVFSPNLSNYETRKVDFGAAPDAKRFEIVNPGTSTERDFIIDVPISKSPAHRIGSTPPPGNYRISAIRSSWPVYGDEARARECRDRWRRYGLLLIARITIEDIRVRISLPREMPQCKG
jgi:hypothetical protein